ncbi:MAG: hypothetical protein WKF75_06285 [Singulisphaera sp.]
MRSSLRTRSAIARPRAGKLSLYSPRLGRSPRSRRRKNSVTSRLAASGSAPGSSGQRER